MSWDGVERRKMDRDWIERDRLLSEVHSDVKHMVQWAKDHSADDDRRFLLVTKEIELGKKIIWSGVGAIAFLEILLKVVK